MRGLQIVPPGTNINFVRFKTFIVGLSTLIVLGTFAGALIKGLNFGIDFRGGLEIYIRTTEKANITEIREKIEALKLGDINVRDFGSDRDVSIRVEQQPGDDKAQGTVLEKVKATLDKNVTYRKVEMVGPKVSNELINSAIWAFIWALVAMLVYIWFRFEWQFSICAILALAHDSCAVIGFYVFSGLQFNETAIIALLLTVGYSINDTVVIYDRIRENLCKFKKMSMPEIINKSTNETLSRTIITSGTTLAGLFALYWFGGTVVQNFVLPIICGITVGTYSSICLASILLLNFDIYRGAEDKNGDKAKSESPSGFNPV